MNIDTITSILVAGAKGPIYIAVAIAWIYLFTRYNKKSTWWDLSLLVIASALSWGLATLLKNYFAVPRPDIFHPPIMTTHNAYSFPSQHAAFMFALGFTMNYLSWRIGFYILLLALITGISRVLVGVHYGYDIIGGAVLGYLVSLVAVYAYKKFFKKD